MGACSDSRSTKNEVSFRCTYDIKDIYHKTKIINEIKTKIKILNNNKKEKIISKKKFDKIGIYIIDFIIEEKLTDMSYMFCDCRSLKKIEFINIDTSNVENMGGMFSGCNKLKEIKGINNFNNSKVKNMKYMFSECKELEYIDLSNFNTSNVENMEYMFSGCNKLKEIKGINNFNTSNVKYMNYMLKGCKELDYLTISNHKIILDEQKLIDKIKYNKNSFNDELIAVVFISTDQQLNFAICCKDLDKFSTIEEKLFKKFPALKSKHIYYLANGNVVDKNLTLKENKIKNSTTIIINYIN